jgi:hypothetical protein
MHKYRYTLHGVYSIYNANSLIIALNYTSFPTNRNSFTSLNYVLVLLNFSVFKQIYVYNTLIDHNFIDLISANILYSLIFCVWQGV